MGSFDDDADAIDVPAIDESSVSDGASIAEAPLINDTFFHHNISSTARKFMVLLEERMLSGRTKVEIRRWATEEMKVPEDKLLVMQQIITESWSRSSRDIATLEAERDELIAKYFFVYRKALDVYDHAVSAERWSDATRALDKALSALDSIASATGTTQPAALNVTVGSSAITSATRDNVVSLIQKMQSLAASRDKSLQPASNVGTDIPTETTPGQNGANGHSNGTNGRNGVKVIDISTMKSGEKRSMCAVCLDCGVQRPRVLPVDQCECGSIRWRAWRETDD